MTQPTGPTHPAVRFARRLWIAGLLTGLGLVFVCAIAWIAIGVRAERAETLARLMASAAILPLLCSFGLVAVRVAGRSTLWRYMIVSMLATLVALVGWIYMIWTVEPEREEPVLLLRILITASVIGPWFAMVGAMLTPIRRTRVLQALRAVVIWAGTVAAIAGTGMLWSPLASRFAEIVLVLGGLGLVVAAVSGAVLLAVSRAAAWRDRGRRESLPATLEVTVTCPKCDEKSPRPTGPSPCPACGDMLLIEVQEPRCECGYLIYRLDRERCPECGRPLGEALGPL